MKVLTANGMVGDVQARIDDTDLIPRLTCLGGEEEGGQIKKNKFDILGHIKSFHLHLS